MEEEDGCGGGEDLEQPAPPREGWLCLAELASHQVTRELYFIFFISIVIAWKHSTHWIRVALSPHSRDHPRAGDISQICLTALFEGGQNSVSVSIALSVHIRLWVLTQEKVAEKKDKQWWLPPPSPPPPTLMGSFGCSFGSPKRASRPQATFRNH